ncbi:cora-domain-containing protein [Sporormia fimetaria CBS 119925]|uniref:Cora-domain-containing protein n=1 Tax=Sporormia fimetaria CBS 119925 TaxID=1340428 RepID=A0A6A6V3E4_9PLEO|nr:cora-domain-containing protein [Sporormia fimetaria CBS 119925]
MASRADGPPGNGSSSKSSETKPEGQKKRKHRGGKKRRNRRQSFAATLEPVLSQDTNEADSSRENGNSQSPPRTSFYRHKRPSSNTSLESEALLDHRGQNYMTPRRSSQVPQIFTGRPSTGYASRDSGFRRSSLHQQELASDNDDDDRTPLMSATPRDHRMSASYGGLSANSGSARHRPSSRSSVESPRPGLLQHSSTGRLGDYHVNNPPSVPGSPEMGPEVSFNDVMLSSDLEHGLTQEESRTKSKMRDLLIDIDGDGDDERQRQRSRSRSISPADASQLRRRMTAMHAMEDVCFPVEGMSELGEQDYKSMAEGEGRRRRRRRRWPDLETLEAFSVEEKEQRTMEGLRTRKVSEPLMVGGRLRPQKRPWHREADDAPYRFTYFNENFENTTHAQTISDLVQPGQTFRDLFIPEPVLIEDSSESESDNDEPASTREPTPHGGRNGASGSSSRLQSVSNRLSEQGTSSGDHTQNATPARTPTPKIEQQKPKRLGPRPAFWLDVLSPTDAEMKVISKAFSIHPLTAEDIMMQEAREKVELFKHYYFINYRTFEQDENNEEYMEPVNLYVIVFREGVISFHFSMTPHPANVRRRIRQLQDYLILSPDWISYAIIDDVTDAYAPLIERIEDEVDEIDEAILRLHSEEEEQEKEKSKSYSYNNPHYTKQPDGTKEEQENGRDMLRRVGECRKKVMSLYRLLGNKADVIKGFAKRCNEQWDVAPRSEIGLYLGDIQDHIVTMTGNLSHYENLLSRAHSNYLAQINIRMNERQEKTSDILGKLTVLGTIVLPMNVVTGVWGMNCLVPGQDIENLNWFWAITGSLVLFAVTSYFIAKRVYGIV